MKRNRSIRKPTNILKPFNYSDKDFSKCGWLKKQGGTFKTFKRRYFILVEDVLFYFTNDTKNCLKGQINLRNLELSELEEEKSSGEFIFSILPELGKESINGTHARYLLSSNVKKEADEWFQLIKQKMYLRKGGGLFGTSLSIVMPYLKKEYGYVPRMIFECCQRIREIGMDEEGIFRKNGQQSLVYQMKNNVDRAKYDWEDVDIHTVCSLLKLYLRELPEPLIPFSHYDSLKAVGYRIDVREDLNLVRDKLLMLPLPNLQLLKYLCEFLLEVSYHRDNRMEISSLAKVFSPNILRDQDTDPYVEESTSSIISITVAGLIRSQKDLFLFEYEPLERYDEDSVTDEDTYSLVSAFSNMNFSDNFLAFDDVNRSTSSLSQEYKTSKRSSSTSFSHDNSSDSLSISAEHTKTDTIKPLMIVGEYTEKTPLSTKRWSLTNGKSKRKDMNKLSNFCKKCQILEQHLLSTKEERDVLQKLYDNKNKTCLQLQDEVEDLRLQLTESRKLELDDSNDLSNMLKYFNVNSADI